ncbi:MAG: glycosyltransferase family 2 protein [Phycisphaerales bacterium]
MLAYIIPTRDRPWHLAHTLAAIAALPPHDAQVIIVDNASSIPPTVPLRLSNDIPVELILNTRNEGAAARNRAASVADASCEWLVMLDDDSAPLSANFLDALRAQPADVLALAAEIHLTSAAREAGGLPEVFIGCGAAVRRHAFLSAGGYDPSFNYYAEEYDLAAKLLLAGGRVALDRQFQVAHRKVPGGRDMNTILRRLVRNNSWVMQRYAPDHLRREEVRRVAARYASIAAREQALPGYAAGIAEWLTSVRAQPRSPMPMPLFDRFTGLAEARASLQRSFSERPFSSAFLIDRGKNDHVIEFALIELGVSIADAPDDADVIVPGSMSPGPLLDSFQSRAHLRSAIRLVSPWRALTGEPPLLRQAA